MALAVSEQRLNVMNNKSINVLCSTDLNALDKISPLNNKPEVFCVKIIFYKKQKRMELIVITPDSFYLLATIISTLRDSSRTLYCINCE